MASGNKRGGAGERVLAGRHVIGLFCLMLIFSGVFFTLGYVMGRSQFEGQVRASTEPRPMPNGAVAPRGDSSSKRAADKDNSPGAVDNANPPSSDWEFYHAGEARKTEDHLNSGAPGAPAARAITAVAKGAVPMKASPVAAKTSSHAPLIPGGAYTLQVAALTKESDALALAGSLQQKKFPAFVMSPAADKYYRVQVGPFADQKTADAAKKGLDAAGFKAIVKH